MEPEDGPLLLRPHVKFSPPKDANTNFSRELQEAFKRHANRVLLVSAESGREWTGACLLDHCVRLATGLIRELHLKPNDVVMTICDHSDEEIAMAMSFVIAGAAFYGTSPSDGYAEVETLCEIVKPDVLVVSGHYHMRAAQLCKRVHGMQNTRIVWLNRPESNGLNGKTNGLGGVPTDLVALNGFSGLNAAQAEEQVYLVEKLMDREPDWDLVKSVAYEKINAKEHVLTYMLTSGSTGRPKIVPSTHEELVNGLYSMISASQNEMTLTNVAQKTSVDSNGRPLDQNNNLSEPIKGQMAHMMPCGPEDIISGDLPLDHGAGFNTTFLSFWIGAKFIVIPSYDVDSFWQAVEDFKISFSLASTTFGYKLFMRLKELIDTGNTNKWDLSSFKYVACCGSKLAFIDLVKEIRQHYTHMNIIQAYGCTEIGFISILHVDDSITHLESTGYLFPGLIAKVVNRDDPNRLCGPNERGELLLWARSKFKGYRALNVDDPVQIYANCHDDRGIFYRTGDQAHYDEQGRLYIHGRYKDTLFLMEDWKILPAELEDVIDEHPAVGLSVVVGVPDPDLPGCHAPKAFIKLAAFNADELRQLSLKDPELAARLEANDHEYLCKHIYDFAAIRTAPPKRLKGGVRIVEDFPRVGLLNKIDRQKLKMLD